MTKGKTFIKQRKIEWVNSNLVIEKRTELVLLTLDNSEYDPQGKQENKFFNGVVVACGKTNNKIGTFKKNISKEDYILFTEIIMLENKKPLENDY